jgi:hypothetical protein
MTAMHRSTIPARVFVLLHLGAVICCAVALSGLTLACVAIARLWH